MPLRRALDAAARLGADGVVLDLRYELPLAELTPTAVRQLRKTLDDRSLKTAAVTFPTRGGLADARGLERRIDALKSAMHGARELGAGVVINRIGRVPDDPDSAAYGQLVESLTTLGLHGDRVGARLAAVTEGASYERLPALLGALPEGAVGVSLHPAELLMADGDPTEATATLGPHVLHVHASDAVRDLSTRRSVEVELGRGGVDWPDVLARLEEHDYRGWLSIERGESDDPVGDVENALHFLRSM